jgi:hypothetical protein
MNTISLPQLSPRSLQLQYRLIESDSSDDDYLLFIEPTRALTQSMEVSKFDEVGTVMSWGSFVEDKDLIDLPINEELGDLQENKSPCTCDEVYGFSRLFNRQFSEHCCSLQDKAFRKSELTTHTQQNSAQIYLTDQAEEPKTPRLPFKKELSSSHEERRISEVETRQLSKSSRAQELTSGLLASKNCCQCLLF